MDSDFDSGTWDCMIVGAGPAGLNAALVLGRTRRRVLVLDSAQPRNYATHEMHGVLGHDGLDPADLRARGRTELGRYGVEVVTAEVEDAEALAGTVRVTSSFGADLTRTVLLATGILDEVPDIPGFAEVWGTTAHTCPYCDGYEHRDERLAILAAGARGEHLAILLRQWSDDVVLLSNGPHGLDADQLARVQALASPSSRRPSSRWIATKAATSVAFAWMTEKRSTAMRCSSTSAGSSATTSPAGWAASSTTTARSRSTQAKQRRSTVSTPPATAPTRGRSSRPQPVPAPPPRSPSTRA